MPDSNARWSKAQTRERGYYEARAGSAARDTPYVQSHEIFWRTLLDRLPEIQARPEGCYVDVGCGPNPIVAMLTNGTRIGIDPLMDFYRQSFVLPSDVTFHQGAVEDLAMIPDGSVDVIFSMNNIDHVRDIELARTNLRRKLKPDGYLVLSVNVVGNPATRVAASVVDVYKVIDPTHTYHFHSPAEVAAAFAGAFELVRFEDVEQVSQDMQHQKTAAEAPRLTAKSAVRNALKFVKNDILLRESLYLFLFKPEVSSRQ